MITSECTNVFRSILFIIVKIQTISAHNIMPNNDKTNLSVAFLIILRTCHTSKLIEGVAGCVVIEQEADQPSCRNRETVNEWVYGEDAVRTRIQKALSAFKL